MRRKLTYATVWAAATACAVTVSWLAVRPVLRDAAFSHPSPVTVDRATQGSPPASAVPRAAPKRVTPAPSAASPSPTKRKKRTAPPSAPPSASPSDSSPDRSDGDVRTYTTIGGRAILTVGPSSATLFNAYPNPGYQVRTHSNTYELRVDFVTATAKSSSVIVTWYQHPPEVQLFEYQQ